APEKGRQHSTPVLLLREPEGRIPGEPKVLGALQFVTAKVTHHAIVIFAHELTNSKAGPFAVRIWTLPRQQKSVWFAYVRDPVFHLQSPPIAALSASRRAAMSCSR